MQAASLAHTERPLLVKEHQLPVAGGSQLASDPQPALSLPTGVGLDGRRNRCSIRQKNNSPPSQQLSGDCHKEVLQVPKCLSRSSSLMDHGRSYGSEAKTHTATSLLASYTDQ